MSYVLKSLSVFFTKGCQAYAFVLMECSEYKSQNSGLGSCETTSFRFQVDGSFDFRLNLPISIW